jgi:hypothetical protein
MGIKIERSKRIIRRARKKKINRIKDENSRYSSSFKLK